MRTLAFHHSAKIAVCAAGAALLGALGFAMLVGEFYRPHQPPEMRVPVSSLAASPFDADARYNPPPPSPERGRHLFSQSCAHCHGDDARGDGEDGDGPDLHGLRISNRRIAALIRTGIPEEMPSFAKKHGPTDIADLIAHLRSLE